MRDTRRKRSTDKGLSIACRRAIVIDSAIERRCVVVKITGLRELLWAAKEGMLVQAEICMLKHMKLIEELPGDGTPKYLLTEKGLRLLDNPRPLRSAA
jgi:hypothetical protein